MRRPPDVRRFLSTAIAHLVLIAFSAAILLPLLWVLRVSLTDRLTAYRIPPRWTVPSLENYVTIFTAYPFPTWFLNSLTVGLGSTAVALPLATALAYAFARYDTGGAALRLSVLIEPDAAADRARPAAVRDLPLGQAAQHRTSPS